VPLHLKEEKGFRFDAADLERLITPRTKVLIINSPSNPTGGVLTGEDIQDIAQVIREKADPSIRIYSDEVYEHIIFGGREHESILSISGMEKNTILVSGHSKTYAMTGWRLGYAVLPTAEEAITFRQLNINIISCTPPFIQEAGKAALDNPENKGIIASMVQEFEKRRDVVVDGLNRIDGIQCTKPEGAFYVFPNIEGACKKLGILEAYERLPREAQEKTSPATLFQMFALYRHGVASLDRRSFGVIGSAGKHYLRLSTATDMASLGEGLRRLEAASQDPRGFRTFLEKGKHLT
jgi:aspartate aminotransferase